MSWIQLEIRLEYRKQKRGKTSRGRSSRVETREVKEERKMKGEEVGGAEEEAIFCWHAFFRRTREVSCLIGYGGRERQVCSHVLIYLEHSDCDLGTI